MTSTATLGTALRHLIEHLDEAVDGTYRRDGLVYRARYTPIVRALLTAGPASIKALARTASISHSAASQTVAHMARDGLVALRPGADARERVVSLTPACEAMLPRLRVLWAAVTTAGDILETELSAPLSALIGETLAALEQLAFASRIDAVLAASTASQVDSIPESGW